MLDTRVVEDLLGQRDLHAGIGLGGAEQDAHALGFRKKLAQQADLVRDGREVRGAGDVATGLLIGGDQTALGVIGDGGAHDRR